MAAHEHEPELPQSVRRQNSPKLQSLLFQACLTQHQVAPMRSSGVNSGYTWLLKPIRSDGCYGEPAERTPASAPTADRAEAETVHLQTSGQKAVPCHRYSTSARPGDDEALSRQLRA